MVKKKNKDNNDNVVSLDLYRSKKNLETIFELYTQMDRTWRWVDDTLSRAPRDLDAVDVYLAALKLSAQRLHDLNFKTSNILKLVHNSIKPKK